ncbi:molecular chaperone Hsp33 [Acidithiobacillus marinus]|uniref:Molecular chaperone Hsp33 n=1 Tax=Acidithiobacillus marinus TaxID=187490 RepID=A0A2I1DJF3_9PROT|nr:Hsp33 family molecular chaperone HslO [Acidithiobacillus marinus]PKY10004.1 molecular chaperone Hsp33 [Acidithiobacillus marinus]
MTDFSQSFYWETLPLRGARCRLDAIYARVLRDFQGQAEVAQLLGEVLVGLALLATTQKNYERLIIQAQSKGPLKLLVAEMTAAGGMRAYGSWEEGVSVDLSQLPDALLAITIDMGMDRDRYQGLVELRDSLTLSLNAYFAESVQSPAYFRLVADPSLQQAGGYFLQRLPGVLAEEDWELATQFIAVGSDQSLLKAHPQQFLPEIFPDSAVRLHEPQALSFACSCSREKVERMLISLGSAEAEDTLRSEGAIVVTCEYCQEVYRFDEADVALLFAPEHALH